MAEVLTSVAHAPSPCQLVAERSGERIIVRPIPEALRTWLPALTVLLCTPLMALIVTKYALMPPMKRAFGPSPAAVARSAEEPTTAPVFFAKLPLQFASVHPTFKSIALVGGDNTFERIIDNNKTRLTELASSELRDTSVSDLDNPGALEAARARLLTDINQALGAPVVKELYISEYPRQ